MKKRNIFLMIAGASFVIAGFTAVIFGKLLIASGNLRDSYGLTGQEPFYAGIGLWIGFLASGAICLTALFLCIDKKASRSSSCLLVGAVCILLIFSGIVIPAFQRYQTKTEEQISPSIQICSCCIFPAQRSLPSSLHTIACAVPHGKRGPF